MCIIAICQDRKLTEKELKNCFENNPDGAGFSFVTDDNEVHIEKGFMTIKELIDAYEELCILPHVVHFRIATSGDVSPELTHPYRVEIDSKLDIFGKMDCPVLFHNGVISDYRTLLLNMVTSGQIKMPAGVMNDTRVAAIMTAVYGEDVLEVLSGKFVIVKPEGITMFGVFEKENGVFFSNNGYKKSVYHCARGVGTKNCATMSNSVMTDSEWADYLDNISEEDSCFPAPNIPSYNMKNKNNKNNKTSYVTKNENRVCG